MQLLTLLHPIPISLLIFYVIFLVLFFRSCIRSARNKYEADFRERIYQDSERPFYKEN